jgi:hypothetical protein
MKNHAALAALSGLLALGGPVAPVDAGTRSPAVKEWRGPEIWRGDVAAFEAADLAEFPSPGAFLFAGSSSIRMWDLKRYFPGLRTLNRAFGGAYISDCVYYADRIVYPYKPGLIVFYAGDNDIADGKPPAGVAADFNIFMNRAGKNLPGVPVVYISIKPSPARRDFWPKMREANRLIEANCAKRSSCRFLDVSGKMLAANGSPDPGLFMPDGLHLNDKGYR